MTGVWVRAPAPAKINLTLRVLRQRPDGFHEIDSTVARISLADTVGVRAARADLTLHCDDPRIPRDRSNLVLRAAEALADAARVEPGAEFELNKRIPAGAGLGGGSSNAATTLLLLNRLWRLEWPRERLVEVGAAIGSDVPLFLADSPVVRLRGRGECVEPLAVSWKVWVGLALPDLHCATAAVYAAWALNSGGHGTSAAAADAQAESVRRARSATELSALATNDLTGAALRVEPLLGPLMDHVRAAGGVEVHLTGSGAALFSLFDERAAAAVWAQRVASATGTRTEVAAIASAGDAAAP